MFKFLHIHHHLLKMYNVVCLRAPKVYMVMVKICLYLLTTLRCEVISYPTLTRGSVGLPLTLDMYP